MEYVRPVAEWAAAILEMFGIGVIILLAAYSTVRVFVLLAKREESGRIYLGYRLQLARGILLGLEFLVAADIIHTVAIDFTYASVGVLAVIVLVRTFLSFALEVEMTGKWPWQKEIPPSR